MATQSAVPPRHQARHRARHSALGWALPLTLGVIYGLYTAAVERAGGVTTGGIVLLGVVSGAVLAAACFLLGRTQKSLPRELRAAAYAALTGIAVGFLFSLSHSSVLQATVLALAVAAAMFFVAFYVFYTRE